MYLKEKLKMKPLKSQKYKSFESLIVQLNIKSKTNLFSLIYRPPSSTKMELWLESSWMNSQNT